VVGARGQFVNPEEGEIPPLEDINAKSDEDTSREDLSSLYS
jgi:hypothetical protein